LLLRGQFNYFSDNGFEVFAASSRDFHVDELLTRENVKWFYVPFVRRFNPFKDLLSFLFLVYYILKIRPEIVHTHSPKAGLLGQLAAFICRVPCRIHTTAGLPLVESNGLIRKILFLAEKFTNSLSQWVLPNSLNLAEYLVKNNLLSKEKVQVIGNGSTNGINIDFYSPTNEIVEESNLLRLELNIPDHSKILLYVGRLANSKGISELVKAFYVIRSSHKNIYLVLVGNVDEEDHLSKEIIKLMNKCDEIICTGHINDVRPYFQMADIFVFPSYREGLPQSLLQASSMAKCCIATDIGGCNEIIEHNINGLLIPTKNIESIIESVEKLLNNKNLSDNLAFSSRTIVKSKYDQKYFYSELKKFYIEKTKKNDTSDRWKRIFRQKYLT
jgi:glycosyltransferase involved in cell wall biosynthesis